MLYQSTTTEWNGGEAEGLTDEATRNIINIRMLVITRQEEYINSLNRSNGTKEAYRWALKAFTRIVGPDAELTTENYIKFLLGIRHLSPTTQHCYASATRLYYDFCKAGDERDLKVADRHYLGKVGKRIVNPDMDAIDQLVDYLQNQTGGVAEARQAKTNDKLRPILAELRDRAFVLLLVDSGLRIHEACKLTRGDIDWKHHQTVVIGKGNKQAVVLLSARCLGAIKDYLSARQRLDGDSGKPIGSLPLFSRHDRKSKNKVMPISKNSMWAAIKGRSLNGRMVQRGRMNEAGVERGNFTIHGLRHYFVTRVMLAKGIERARVLARHESIATTQRYSHLNDTLLREDYKEIFD